VITLTYLFDPLRGWCYGARPMDANFAAYAWANDQRIAQMTGLPFSPAYRDGVLGAGGLLDSTWASLGVLAAGIGQPTREWDALKALQHARYADGRDNGDPVVVAQILREAGFADAAQQLVAPDAPLLATFQQRVADARADMARFGVRGLPALVVGDGADRRLVPGQALFGPVDALLALLSPWHARCNR
jgi:putative protein-disulfide isomerase